MLSAEEYARAKELMCSYVRNTQGCSECPLNVAQNRLHCGKFIVVYPAEAVKRVELWLRKQNKKIIDVIKGE